MKIVSYWNDVKEIYHDDEFVLITGTYNHKHQYSPKRNLGVHWRTYPKSHNILSPCVIPEKTRNAILSGLLHQATIEGNTEDISKLINAIKYLNNEEE